MSIKITEETLGPFDFYLSVGGQNKKGVTTFTIWSKDLSEENWMKIARAEGHRFEVKVHTLRGEKLG